VGAWIETIELEPSGLKVGGAPRGGFLSFIEICQVKYLNNLLEQDHRFIKKITKAHDGLQYHHRRNRNSSYNSKEATFRGKHSGLQAVYGFSRIILHTD
jgi:transposase-like protein